MPDPADAAPANAVPAAAGPADPGPHPQPEPQPPQPQQEPQQPQPQRRRRWRRTLTELAVTIVAAVALSALVRTFAFQTFWIPTASMTPTLGVYDRILVQKAFFTWRDVREGDIVVFSHPPLDRCSGPQDDLVKRVIALPGQTIYSAGNSIYIDGRPLAEPYLPQYDPLGTPVPSATSQHPYRVPPGEFYVMGDDRANSCDSRYWGPIKGPSIIGKAVLDIWHNGHPNFKTFLPNVTSLLAPFPRSVSFPPSGSGARQAARTPLARRAAAAHDKSPQRRQGAVPAAEREPAADPEPGRPRFHQAALPGGRGKPGAVRRPGRSTVPYSTAPAPPGETPDERRLLSAQGFRGPHCPRGRARDPRFGARCPVRWAPAQAFAPTGQP